MGYIAPVHNFQYNDYQLRTMDDKPNPYFINKPFRSVLEAQYQDIKNHPEEIHQKFTFNNEDLGSQARRPHEVTEYEALTGKGNNFSVSV